MGAAALGEGPGSEIRTDFGLGGRIDRKRAAAEGVDACVIEGALHLMRTAAEVIAGDGAATIAHHKNCLHGVAPAILYERAMSVIAYLLLAGHGQRAITERIRTGRVGIAANVEVLGIG